MNSSLFNFKVKLELIFCQLKKTFTIRRLLVVLHFQNVLSIVTQGESEFPWLNCAASVWLRALVMLDMTFQYIETIEVVIQSTQ